MPLTVETFLAVGLITLCCICLAGAVPEQEIDTKVYALYFPQFHADKINDDLWEKGFTDWNNLRASPKMNKLNNPLPYPSELGFYDLLDHDVRKKQRELAMEYGIDGFIYHHYWFNHEGGGATLAASIEKLLDPTDGEPDVSFAFNWAKESWVTTWHGHFNKATESNNTLLVEQITPDPSDPRVVAHYEFLSRFFHHKNYIKVNGAPLLTIYGGETLAPATLALLGRLRELAMADGFPSPGLHVPLLRRMSHHTLYMQDANKHRARMVLKQQEIAASTLSHFDALAFYPFNDPPQRQMSVPPQCSQDHEYIPPSVRVKQSAAQTAGGAEESTAEPAAIGRAELPSYLGVNSVFDNTPRRSFNQAHIYDRNFSMPISTLRGATSSTSSSSSSNIRRLSAAESFALDIVTALMFDRCCQEPQLRSKGGRYLMLNAWNEWGEGMMLEPSDVHGRRLLEAVRTAKKVASDSACDWKAYDNFVEDLYLGAGIKSLQP